MIVAAGSGTAKLIKILIPTKWFIYTFTINDSFKDNNNNHFVNLYDNKIKYSLRYSK